MPPRALSVVVRNNRLPEITEALPGQVRQSAYQSAQAVQARARGLAPVDTGALRDSIAVEQDRSASGRYTEAFAVSSPLEYAIFQEYGFHHWRSGAFIPPQPFMTPASAQEWPPYQQRTVVALRKLT